MGIEELKSEASDLGISENAIKSCGDSLICLIGLIKYKYLKDNLDKFNYEVEFIKEEILKEEQKILEKLFLKELNKNVDFELLDFDNSENGIQIGDWYFLDR